MGWFEALQFLLGRFNFEPSNERLLCTQDFFSRDLSPATAQYADDRNPEGRTSWCSFPWLKRLVWQVLGDKKFARPVQLADFGLQVYPERLYLARVRCDCIDWSSASVCAIQWVKLQGSGCLLQQHCQSLLQEWEILACCWLLQQSSAHGLRMLGQYQST